MHDQSAVPPLALILRDLERSRPSVSGIAAITIAARQQRQEILYDTTKTFTFVITEAALRWGFCPPDVTAAQASHIFGRRYFVRRSLFGTRYGSSPFLVQLWGSRFVATAQISDRHVATICASSAAVASPGSRKTFTCARL